MSNPSCGSNTCACKSASSSSSPSSSTTTTTASTVRLPKRQNKNVTRHDPKSAIWGIDNQEGETSALLKEERDEDSRSSSNGNGNANGYNPAKNYGTHGRSDTQDLSSLLKSKQTIADRCDRPDGVCCKDEVVEERKLIDPDVVRDM